MHKKHHPSSDKVISTRKNIEFSQQLSKFAQIDLDKQSLNVVVNDYDPISDYYDQLIGDDFLKITYETKVDAINRLLNGHIEKCFDLCCGTGSFLLKLKTDYGCEVNGIDLSKKNIEHANKKAASKKMECNFYQGNILEIIPKTNLDLITINFDALNHIGKFENWKKVFKTVFNSLKNGGAFLFDLNTLERIMYDWNYPEVIIKESVTYIQYGLEVKKQGQYYKRKTPMIVFSKEENCFYKRSVAVVEHLAVPNEEVISSLKETGFCNIRSYSLPPDIISKHIFLKNRSFFEAVR